MKIAYTIYTGNPKESTKNLIELIDKFNIVPGYKINVQKSDTFLYTKHGPSELEIKKTMPFTIASKRIKYLGINFKKKV